MYPLVKQKFVNTWTSLFQKKRKITFHYTKLLGILTLLPETLSILVVFLLGVSVVQGHQTLGDFTYYQGIVGQVLVSLQMVIYNYSQISNGKMRIKNYLKFMQIENKVINSGSLVLGKRPFTIEFKNVYFRYEEGLPYILKNLNFKINSDQKIALVGVNGCGKTSLIKLLLRFYDPDEGEIHINGKNIKEYNLDDLRAHFSTMMQDYCNYAFTVHETVALSDFQYADNIEKINSSLKKGTADTFVQKFPNGIETYLTRQYEEDGQELSGGQWQKIALSRAFFHEADVYILDEPSASLDAEAEEELFQQFELLYQNKGAIMVSHRLSNITNVDQIFVLDSGSIIESGTHQELMQLEGKYAKMYTLQAKKYVI